MRVAFVSFDYGEYCVRTAGALAEQPDVAVKLLLPDSKVAEFREQLSPALLHGFFQRVRFRQPLKQVKMIREIWATIEAFRPDVVHFQGAHLWFNFVLNQLAKRYPLVVTAHNPRHHIGDKSSRKTPQWVMDRGFRSAQQVIVHGSSLREQLAADLRLDPEAVHVVPHIAMGGRKANAVDVDPNMVLFFGRIWQYKGLEYLIKSEPLVSQVHGDVRFVIAGQGEDFARYSRMMHNPERFETHIERVSDAQREQLFAEAAMVVLPYISATQSGVVPIAFNHSKPVIATNVGALGEVVLDGETGLLVPPRDERALANAIIRLLSNRTLRERLGAAGKRLLDEQCSDEVVAERHLEVYQLAIDRFDRASSCDGAGQ